MQILLDKIKIELFVLNFQKVYSIFFLAAFSLTSFFLAGWGRLWGRGPKELLMHKSGSEIIQKLLTKMDFL